jgi:hypothetical protein
LTDNTPLQSHIHYQKDEPIPHRRSYGLRAALKQKGLKPGYPQFEGQRDFRFFIVHVIRVCNKIHGQAKVGLQFVLNKKRDPKTEASFPFMENF